MNYAILGSGSKANSFIFSNDISSCLVDNGYSFYQLTDRLNRLNFDLKKIKFILVTHTHKDHIDGVKICAKKLKIPIYINKDSDYLEFFKKSSLEIRPIELDKTYKFDKFSFVAFETSHDAKGSCSYSINFDGLTFTIITDTGKITKNMVYYASISDVLFLEANYNPLMLKSGPYPIYLKKRIESIKGHLSNIDAINFLNFLSKSKNKIKIVYLCHMSEVNNTPQVLMNDIKIHGKFNFNFVICPRDSIHYGIKLVNNFENNKIAENVIESNYLF